MVGEKPRKTDKCPPFGVVLFDDPTFATSSRDGWASKAGETPRRHRGVTDLDSSVIWITNADFNAAKADGFSKIHNLRGESFLGASIRAVMDDLCLGEFDANSDAAAMSLGQIADRTCRVAWQNYKSPALFSKFSLAQGIQQAIFPPSPEPPPELAAAMESAYQKNSSCESGKIWIPNAHRYKMRFPRVSYAEDVLKALVPEGPVSFLPGEEAAAHGVEFWTRQPALLRVSITQVDPKVAPILAFGSSFTHSKILREWASSLELMLLSQYATVEIKGAFVWERWGAIPPDQQLPGQLFSDPLVGVSYSAGLVAESHMTAALSPQWEKGGYVHSARSIFVAARDRVLSFQLARELMEEGFSVCSYGGGSAQIKVQKSDRKAVDDFAQAAGLAFPVAGYYGS